MQAIWSFEAGRLAAKDEGGNVVRSWTAEQSMGLFLAAFHVLGMLGMAAPELDVALWQMDSPALRSRPGLKEHDDDYF